jgi:hypothetical protein
MIRPSGGTGWREYSSDLRNSQEINSDISNDGGKPYLHSQAPNRKNYEQAYLRIASSHGPAWQAVQFKWQYR